MADIVYSPYMNLPVPVVSTDPGPDWANNINACLSGIDQHNHSTGQGAPVTVNGLMIDGDLTLNGFNLTAIRSARFTNQPSALGLGTDLACLYVTGGNLYYNSLAGAQVQLTNGGSIVGAAGTITGLPSGTASASFAGGAFTFNSATLTPAAMNVGPVAIGNSTASSKTVTIAPNASIASNYALTLPAALPAALNYMTLDASGNVSFNSSGSTGSGANVLAVSPTFTGTLTASAVAASGLVSSAGGVQATGHANSATTDTTLTISDNPHQIFNNLSGQINVTLPSSGVRAGDTWTIDIAQPSTVGSSLSPQASDATQFTIASGAGINTEIGCSNHQKVGRVVMKALINTPVTNTDWQVVSVQDSYKWTGTTAGAGTLAFTASMIRFNNVVTVQIYSALGAASGTAALTANSVPSRIQPSAYTWASCIVTRGGQSLPGSVQITNDSSHLFNFFNSSVTWSGSSNGIGGNGAAGAFEGGNPTGTSFTYDMYNIY